MSTHLRYWAVIPAAGVGTRMQTDVPKQYLSINHKTILEHTLSRFCLEPVISGVVVVISKDDNTWESLSISSDSKITVARGGVLRCHSVLNGLHALSHQANKNDWVLVHDAARPCLRKEDINLLINTIGEHAVGGLLGVPVKDTMKQADATGTIQKTVGRKGLWHALTPQMFRLGILIDAIENALSKDLLVTDEAQAIELNGLQPILVEGRLDNIKITRNNDLIMAKLFLAQKEGN